MPRLLFEVHLLRRLRFVLALPQLLPQHAARVACLMLFLDFSLHLLAELLVLGDGLEETFT